MVALIKNKRWKKRNRVQLRCYRRSSIWDVQKCDLRKCLCTAVGDNGKMIIGTLEKCQDYKQWLKENKPTDKSIQFLRIWLCGVCVIPSSTKTEEKQSFLLVGGMTPKNWSSGEAAFVAKHCLSNRCHCNQQQVGMMFKEKDVAWENASSFRNIKYWKKHSNGNI